MSGLPSPDDVENAGRDAAAFFRAISPVTMPARPRSSAERTCLQSSRPVRN
jgi:hypothetical protein